MMTNTGIDYGLGTTNIDTDTGIRFGVIHQNEVLQAWCDSSEGDYGEATCPKCGNEVIDYSEEIETETENYTMSDYACNDLVCHPCQSIFDTSEVYSDEPNGFTLDDGEYKASSGEYGDIFITSSPYYTTAQFCSPCAPGAVYLMNSCDDGAKGYCFGHDWFEGGKAPYPVYRVSDGEMVQA